MDPDGWRWSYPEELLAALIELVDYGNRLFFSANVKKGTRVPKPVQIIRPWQRKDHVADAAPRRQATASEIEAFFGKGRK